MRNIYFARSNEFLGDYDSERSFRTFQERLPKIEHMVKRVVVLATRRGHYHVYCLLDGQHRFVDLSALAVYLGSDIRRELSNMSRIMAGASKPILLIEFTKVPHWRKPDIVCSCPRMWKGWKLGNCRHLLAVKAHKPKYGFLSTRLKILGVKDPYGRT